MTARRDDEVVAAAWGWSARGALEVADLVVAAEHRGQGIGRHLLAAVVALARRRDCELVGAGAPRGGGRRRAAGRRRLPAPRRPGRRGPPLGAVPRAVRRRRRRLVTDGSSLLDRLERPWVAVGLCVAVYLPFVLLGYGTDIDVGNVLEAGRRWLDHGDYAVSRVPGAAIHEVSTAFLDDVGGSVLVNVASVLFAGLALWGLQDLLRREGSRIAGLAVLVLATNPWFWIAATSLGDFVWALGLLLAGAVAARRDHRVLAGVLFALAMGCRLSTVFLVGAWLVAEQLGDRRRGCRCGARSITGAIALGARRAVLRAVVAVGRSHARLPRDARASSRACGSTSADGRSRTWRSSACWPASCWCSGCRGCAAPGRRGTRRWPSASRSLAFVATEVVYLRFPFKPRPPHPGRDGGGARHRPLRHRGPPLDRRAHRRPARSAASSPPRSPPPTSRTAPPAARSSSASPPARSSPTSSAASTTATTAPTTTAPPRSRPSEPSGTPPASWRPGAPPPSHPDRVPHLARTPSRWPRSRALATRVRTTSVAADFGPEFECCLAA